MISFSPSVRRISAPPSPALALSGDPAVGDATPIFTVDDDNGATLRFQVRENGQVLIPASMFVDIVNPYASAGPRFLVWRALEQTDNANVGLPGAASVSCYIFRDPVTGAYSFRIKLNDNTIRSVALT